MTDFPHLYPLPIGPGRLRPLNSEMRLVAAHFFPLAEETYGVTRAEIIGKCRRPVFVRPRQFMMYALAYWSTASLPRIGEFLGGRDHTTVLHGWRRHAQLHNLPADRTFGRVMPKPSSSFHVETAQKYRDLILSKRAERKTYAMIVKEIAIRAVTRNMVIYVVQKYGTPEMQGMMNNGRTDRMMEKVQAILRLYHDGESSCAKIAKSLGLRHKYVADMICKLVPAETKKARRKVPMHMRHYDEVVRLAAEGKAAPQIVEEIGQPDCKIDAVRRALEVRAREWAEAAE